jgi:serine/threonine-protein kinase
MGARGGQAVAEAGDVVADKYEITGVLGEGGTGIVYDAVRKEDDKPVALKVMHAHLAGDKQIRGRFQREAAILRRLEGPHICPILEAGEVPGDEPGSSLLFIALPKLEGRSLESLMRGDLLPIERALAIMLEVCQALRGAHAQGIIHRDLKPANVIVDAEDKVVVVDFGMSKIVTGAGTGTTNLTAHNMLFGTPEYMSPEQARGDELDARCDVYAAGIMLYEMLTGAPPFAGATPLNVLTAHLTSDIEVPSRRAPAGRISAALESVVMHALARDREQRYPSASALAAAIMHARARPDDVASLRPEAFATSPQGTDAFAVTMPAIGVSKASGSSRPPLAVVDADARPSARTIKSDMPPPMRASETPATQPSAALPAPAPRTSAPPSGRDRATTAAAASAGASPGAWKTWALWALAAAASIGLGIYFALR